MNILESPFLVYVLGAFALGLIVFGIGFAIRSLRELEDEKTAVPISNVQEIKIAAHAEARPNLRPLDSEPTLARHLVQENLSTAPAGSEDSLKHEIKLLKQQLLEQEQAADEKVKQLEDALKREIGSKDKNVMLEAENQEIRALKEEREKSTAAISRLTEENQSLLKTNQMQQGLVAKIEAAFNQLKTTHEEIVRQKAAELDAYKDKFKNAETIATQLQKTTDEFNNAIEQTKLLHEVISQRDTEILSLKKQITEIHGQQQTGIDHHLNTINALKQELAGLKPTIAREFEEKARQFKIQLDEANAARNEAMTLKEKAQADYLELKDLNRQLLEKERILQYELTKYRAQVLGLEKICEDFKLQIDHFTVR